MVRGIQIIRNTEKFKLGSMETTGYCFHYRRIPNHIRGDIMNRHTRIDKRGREHTDTTAAGIEMLQYCIRDWENGSVTDTDGTPLAFDPELIQYLPDEIQSEILEAAGANIGNNVADGDAEKN